MRSPDRDRYGGEWLGAALAALVAAGPLGCGRIGYALLPQEVEGQPRDAAADHDRAPDASSEGMTDAPMDAIEASSADAVIDAPIDASVDVEAADAADAAADASPEADAMCAVSAVVDYCTAIPPLPAPPVIDGVLDCGPALVAMPPVDWSGPPPLPPFPPGNSTEFAAAWRPDGLYVFMAVTTPAAFPADVGSLIYCGAGVEIFVDNDGVYANAPTYDSPGTIQFIVTAPPNATTESTRADGLRNAVNLGPWTSSEFGAYPTPTGFVFEGFIVAADLGLTTWPLAAGATIGFDLAVDVSYTTFAMTGTQGHRVGQYFFHIAPPPVGDAAAIGMAYADPRSFCAPQLAPM